MAVSEKELLAKATNLDQRALGALLEQYGPQVREGTEDECSAKAIPAVPTQESVWWVEYAPAALHWR